VWKSLTGTAISIAPANQLPPNYSRAEKLNSRMQIDGLFRGKMPHRGAILNRNHLLTGE